MFSFMASNASHRIFSGNRGQIGLKPASLLLFFAFLLLFVYLPTSESQATFDDPRIYINKDVADLGEPFSLSWHEPYAEQVWLFYRYEEEDFQSLSTVDASCDGYTLSKTRPGKWSFLIMVKYHDDIHQSNEVSVYVKSGGRGKAKSDLNLYTNRAFLKPEQRFALSWYEEDSGASYIHLWRRRADGDYEYVAGFDKKTMDGYGIVPRRIDLGEWYYCLTADCNGVQRQSNEIKVTVSDSAGETNNIWNILFVIYERADVGNFHKTFSEKQISEIYYYADNIKYTMEGITGGRMRIGTVEVVRISEPITSVSGDNGKGFRALTYGPGGDADFSDLLATRDIQCVVVYAPISYLEGTEGWYGLSPFTIENGGTPCRAMIINNVDLKRTYYTMDGVSYSIQIGIIVHEMLHLVEDNSRANGWSGFESLHSASENGYPNKNNENGDYPWHRDLTRDQLKNGKDGFHKESFYIRHK